MGKGDDAIQRRKNKAYRKKNHMDGSNVSSRVALIIAAKKRRKAGKRRLCQGMCFSLPTPEDPFNDRHKKMDTKREETKKPVSSLAARRMSSNGDNISPRKTTRDRNHANIDLQKQKILKVNNLDNEKTLSHKPLGNMGQKSTIKQAKIKIQLIGNNGAVHSQLGQDFENSDYPSKFLFMCLNSIQNALRHDETLRSEEDKPLFVDTWGVEFWRCYSAGKDILETSGACSNVEQIAWVAAVAADTITKKEKEGLSFTSPFLLFLVPSQEKATKVRSVCKSLKALGVHSVSLHPGASIDHQIHGLRSCEPEFLVSTTERLLELVSLGAIDISGISLLVIDGLGTFVEGGYLDNVKSIRQAISGSPHTVVFNDSLNNAVVPFVQNLLRGSICRLSLSNSIESQSACIVQSVHVCIGEEEKLQKGIQILDQACGNQLGPQPFKVLFVVGKDSDGHNLVTAVKNGGYSVSTNTIFCDYEEQISKMKPAVFVVDLEHVRTADVGEFELVIFCDFALSIENYVQILRRMARFSVNGVLHSFLAREEVQLARPLIEILEQCGQAVPESLRNLCNLSSSVSKN